MWTRAGHTVAEIHMKRECTFDFPIFSGVKAMFVLSRSDNKFGRSKMIKYSQKNYLLSPLSH